MRIRVDRILDEVVCLALHEEGMERVKQPLVIGEPVKQRRLFAGHGEVWAVEISCYQDASKHNPSEYQIIPTRKSQEKS